MGPTLPIPSGSAYKVQVSSVSQENHYPLLFLHTSSRPEIEVVNHFWARCCGRVAQSELHSASERDVYTHIHMAVDLEALVWIVYGHGPRRVAQCLWSNRRFPRRLRPWTTGKPKWRFHLVFQQNFSGYHGCHRFAVKKRGPPAIIIGLIKNVGLTCIVVDKSHHDHQ